MRISPKPLLVVCMLLAATSAYGADKSEPLRDRLKTAAELSALDGKDVQPWHWTLDLTVSDSDGKTPQIGLLEMWFSGNQMLTQYSIGADRMTVLRVGDKLYRSDGDLKKLPSIEFIQMQLLHPIPDEVFQPNTTQSFSKEKVGQLAIESIAPTLAQNKSETVATGRPFSFLFLNNSPTLLMTYEPGDFRVLRQTLGKFQGHEVPTDLQVFIGTAKLTEAKTLKLEALTTESNTFEVKPEMVAVAGPIELSSGALSKLMLSQSSPVYPMDAKVRHASGSIVFDAIIGQDGHVQSLQPVGSTDASLLAAAKAAINTWIYRPFLINGVPFEVKSQIRVNFSFG